MSRKTAFLALAAPPLMGLAIACTSASEPGAAAAGASREPAHASPETAHPGDAAPVVAHDADAERAVHGDGAASGHAMDPHGREEPGERRIGAEVRDFATTDSVGEAFRLTELRKTGSDPGAIAVLTFWCTTCSSCRGIERRFDAQARAYEQRGVSFFMVDSNRTDDAQRVNRFKEEKDLGFRVLMDPQSELARYFGARLTTTTAVVDAEGRLRYYGGFDGAEPAVRNLIAGEPVAVPEKPGGG